MQTNRRIVVALPAEEQDYQQLQAEEARIAARRNGLEAEVLFSDNNAILQIQQLFEVVHRPAACRPLAIVVETVASEGLERLARAATAAGIGWVLVNRRGTYLADLRRQHPQIAIASVSTDQVEVGRIQARQFRALIPSGEGVVLYLQGPAETSVAQDRLEGTRAGLAGTRIELKALDGTWTEASGTEALERWIRLKTSAGEPPDVVGCQNDAMAVGARKALEARPEFAQVLFTGCDGVRQGGQHLVDLRLLTATIITPASTGPAVHLVAQAFRTAQPAPPEVLLAPASYPHEDELARRAVARSAIRIPA